MRRRRIAAGLVLAGIVAATAIAPQSTLAAWRVPTSGAASFTAITVPRPTIASCVFTPGPGGTTPRISIAWTAPSGYTSGQAQFGYTGSTGLQVVTGPLLSSVSTTGTAPNYTTVFSSGLLGNVIGGSTTVGIQLVHSSGWASAWSTATATSGLLGSNPSCTITP